MRGRHDPPPLDAKFGRLTVTGEVHVTSSKGVGRWDWTCICDCGKALSVRKRAVQTGHTTSCGCFHSERVAGNNYRHGLSRTAIYGIWIGMWTRCTKPGHDSYPDYGGRGITICDRWKVFTNFAADMGPRPSPRHSLDRMNNDGNYEPSNCRWATPKQQANNTRWSKAKSVKRATNIKEKSMTEEQFVEKRRQLQVARQKWKGNRPMTSRLSNVLEELENLREPESPEHEAALRRMMAYQLNGIAQIMKDGGKYIPENHRYGQSIPTGDRG